MRTKSKVDRIKVDRIKIFISSGEPSGDNLGYDLIKSILQINPKTEIKIIGSKKMESLGYKSLFPQHEISVMGYFEILTKIFRIKRRIAQTVKFLEAFQPDLYIAIDSRGFNFRVIKDIKKRLKGTQTKYLNYVSPTIWAYRYKRIFDIKKLFDHQFLLYPFEKKFYDEVGIPNTFIGHPFGYTNISKIKNNDYTIGIFPGSREQEIDAHMSVFMEAVKMFQKSINKPIKVFISTLNHLKYIILSHLKSCNLDDNIIELIISDKEEDKDYFLRSADLFLTKSGTISLELMQYNTPMIVAHKISKITAYFLKRYIKVKYVSIGNLVANREIIPELLQENCTSEKIASKMEELSVLNPSYNKYLDKLQNASKVMPQDLAAKTIFQKILKISTKNT